MGMTREEVIETMIDVVNVYNIELLAGTGMPEEEIERNLIQQRPALEHMFGLIYQTFINRGILS
jgi:hypothetical protein